MMIKVCTHKCIVELALPISAMKSPEHVKSRRFRSIYMLNQMQLKKKITLDFLKMQKERGREEKEGTDGEEKQAKINLIAGAAVI